MRRIKQVRVTYDDDTVETFEGRGTLSQSRTGDTDSSMLKDNQIHYITISLRTDS